MQDDKEYQNSRRAPIFKHKEYTSDNPDPLYDKLFLIGQMESAWFINLMTMSNPGVKDLLQEKWNEQCLYLDIRVK